MTSPAAQILANRIANGGNGRPIARVSPFVELGTSGLQRTGGWIHEEFLTQLSGDRALTVYREMRDNSATVGAVLFAIEMLAREVSKRVESQGESSEDDKARELVETALEDMSQAWDDILGDILSCLVYGWSFHEIVYKRRQGEHRQPGLSSRYDDGLIGWRKWPIRSQSTRFEWIFDADGGIQGMHQVDYYVGRSAMIPIEKALLFRPFAYKNNPEGRSLLRNAYRPWFYSKRIEEIEAIGIERDLAGLPVVSIPAEVMNDTAKYEDWKKLVANVKRNEQAGIVLPSDLWGETDVPQYKIELLSTGGERQVNTNEVLQRYRTEIMQTVLADFIQLGQQGVGSLALGQTKASVFATAMNALMNNIASVINRHAIPRLLELNAIKVDTAPELVFDDVEYEDLVAWAEAIGKMAAAGMPIFPDPLIENVIRHKLDLPELTEDEIKDREVEDEAQAELEQRQREARVEGAEMAAQAPPAGAGKQPPVDKE